MPTTDEGSATIFPSSRAAGRITVPGDKSISHRFAIVAALATGTSTIRGYSTGFDCRSTLACLRALGVEIDWTPKCVTIVGRGLAGLSPSSVPLDAGNSGTTLRLLSGILAAHGFKTVLGGDESLNRRPMRRVIAPLSAMGARIDSNIGRPPLVIQGGGLRGITHLPEVPSAQVKSCVLLAGLHASGTTTVEEPTPTRDHTERALEAFGGRVTRGTNSVTVDGGQSLEARDVTVPGDISSAMFWCALAAGTPGGEVTVDGVGLNPTRTAVLDLLDRAGADVTVSVDGAIGAEPTGRIVVRASGWQDVVVAPDDVPGLIDEIPALAALAAMMPAGRRFEVRGARELRVKESDRISALATGFRAMGSEVDEFDDGFRLTARPLRGAEVFSYGDHRVAMAFAIAATRASAVVTIHGAAAAAVSYPTIFETLAQLTEPEGA
ncbi:MAG: 3-phosphoshikimate 1-carboxyvinyltransferase [Acidobacteria bacterium]|nr:3-phosphoshikimate 1-carboxyvinyltransferase [Acidobacteriota bacterium]